MSDLTKNEVDAMVDTLSYLEIFNPDVVNLDVLAMKMLKYIKKEEEE